MDEPVALPVISVEDAPGTALIMLPGVNMDRLEKVSFEINGEVLCVTCKYEEDQTFGYNIQITEDNRETIESMKHLAVMNPSEVEPRKLTSDPEKIKRLRRVKKDVKSMSDQIDPEGLNSKDNNLQTGTLENGENGVN